MNERLSAIIETMRTRAGEAPNDLTWRLVEQLEAYMMANGDVIVTKMSISITLETNEIKEVANG